MTRVLNNFSDLGSKHHEAGLRIPGSKKRTETLYGDSAPKVKDPVQAKVVQGQKTRADKGNGCGAGLECPCGKMFARVSLVVRSKSRYNTITGADVLLVRQKCVQG